MFKYLLADSRPFQREKTLHWPQSQSRVAASVPVKPKSRPLPTIANALADFELLEEWSEVGSEELQDLLLGTENCGCCSLYAVDCVEHWLYFVFTKPEDVESVYRAPFLYGGQQMNADKLIRCPVETAQDIVSQRVVKSINLPRLSFIFGVPRSGTTLLCKIVHAAGAYFQNDLRIVSLSEPDVLSELVRVRSPGGSNDDLIVDYLELMLPWICRGLDGASLIPLLQGDAQKDPPTVFVIKPRSEVSHIIDLIQRAYSRLVAGKWIQHDTAERTIPCIVSLRQCSGVVKSMAKLMSRDIQQAMALTLEEGTVEDLKRQIPVLARQYSQQDEMDETVVSGIEIVTGMWCSCVESCEKYVANHSSVTVQYDEWSRDPRNHIDTMLRHLKCTITETDEALIEACLKAMDEDSQAGTNMSGQGRTLQNWTAEHDEDVERALAKMR
ncbi:Sulfotransferase domain [Seminavis robusta]|uniref:Sulfotransferase domain n=1 Tax=Seminavis robusta TaxID=568900 RepID=A0A9N8EJ52_9STRA|nr:Sulfotransferase domain [Seminavis robusta]|eukprot:Sro1185_g250240.1 Sulfotransferase domain (441) ;mRNA; r:29324-30646